MITIEVSGFRGIESATVEASPIALIAGRNEAGKSSICIAAAAALANCPVPYLRPGAKAGQHITLINKSSAGVLVRGGSASAEVSVSGDAGTVTARWPTATTEVEGDAPPSASVYAAGLIDICALDAKARAAFLSELLKTEPDRNDLAQWLLDHDYEWDDDAPPEKNAVTRTWASIEKVGWDTTEKMFREQGAKLKGQWETITNERYGSNKAEGWLPENWEPELEDTSMDTLDSAVTETRTALEKAIADQAVGEDRIAAARKAADAVMPDIEALKKTLGNKNEDVKQAVKYLESTPRQQEGFITLSCVHCDEPNALVTDRDTGGKATGYRLTAVPVLPSENDEEAAREHEETLRAQVRKNRDAHTEAAEALKIAERTASIIQDGKRQLAEFKKHTGDGADVDQAREAVRLAEERRTTFLTWKTANQAHAGIGRNNAFVGAIAIDGIRATKLKEALTKFNKGALGMVCKAAGWPSITLDTNLEPLCNGVPHILMATSGQYRTKVALQLAVAMIDGSAMVVIDGADVLDAQGRNGLFKMLKKVCAKSNLTAIVSMTLNNPGLMPNLKKAKMGTSYWVRKATCNELGQGEAA